ncbi:hypothetical protein [Salinibacterium sp. PAMC 21357]|nr:hypothetical protein [Salinibacterium sp. PAMC 21357]
MNAISVVTFLGKLALITTGVVVALTGLALLLNLVVPSLLSGFTS